MASVTVKETPAKVVKTFTLELSEAEAATLVALTGKCSGSAERSPRGHTSNIYTVLVRAGLGFWAIPESDLIKADQYSIHFDDYSDDDRDRRAAAGSGY